LRSGAGRLNTILVKVPIAGFKGKNWQNPEKWMFTVVQAGGDGGFVWEIKILRETSL